MNTDKINGEDWKRIQYLLVRGMDAAHKEDATGYWQAASALFSFMWDKLYFSEPENKDVETWQAHKDTVLLQHEIDRIIQEAE